MILEELDRDVASFMPLGVNYAVQGPCEFERRLPHFLDKPSDAMLDTGIMKPFDF